MTDELFFTDLVAGPHGLGTPFIDGGRDPTKGLDCKSVCWLMIRRAGKSIPEHPVLGAEDCEGDDAKAYLDAYLTSGADGWKEVAPPYQLGDLILSEGELGPHASAVVSLQPCRAITAMVQSGVVVIPVHSITNVHRVLRWDP